MGLIILALYLALVGFIVWLILQIPMPPVFRNVILGLVIVLLIIFVLQQLGAPMGNFPRLHL